MRILLFSTLFYLIGVAVILFFRPALMFHKDGRWKEFSIADKEEGSIFPFWFFCIAWALASFLLGRLLVGDDRVDFVESVMGAGTLASSSQSLTTRFMQALEDDEESVEPLPAPARKPKKKKPVAAVAAPAPSQEEAKPGYYRLNKEALKKTGVPRYIYVGPEAPADSSDEE